MMPLTVIIPTHNPDRERLRRTLAGLAAQTLPRQQWDCVIVDNASGAPVATSLIPPANLSVRVVREETLGLTSARRRGLAETAADLCVLVDDDNVLAPDYLAEVVTLFATHPQLGAAGGRVVPEFSQPPERWQQEFFGLLALRDLGNEPLVSAWSRDATKPRAYPTSAPIGAGMALRRAALAGWIAAAAGGASDRRGRELSSGGDNEIVLHVLAAGWEVAYFPTLHLTHLIPAERLGPSYLARLNRGIQKSWMQVLARHQISPWPPIPAWTVPPRQWKAWITLRAWSHPAAHIRWQGVCGHFEGRVRP